VETPLAKLLWAKTLMLGSATTPLGAGRGTVDGLTTGLGLAAGLELPAGFEPSAGLGFTAALEPPGGAAAGVAAGATAGAAEASGVDGVRPAGSARVGPLLGVRSRGVTPGAGGDLAGLDEPARNLASAPDRERDQGELSFSRQPRGADSVAGGGGVVVKTRGSGGAIDPDGAGAESNRSESTSSAIGARSSVSDFAATGAGLGVFPRRGVRAAELRASSALNGTSSPIGSISSVRSSPP
jgi:hypothetical protein